MCRCRFLSLVLTICLLLVLQSIRISAYDNRPLFAVLPFDDSKVAPWWAYSSPGPGKGLTDVFITKLVEKKEVRVIERTELNKVLAEQKLSNASAFDTNTAIKLGKLLGVQYIAIGKVTEFSESIKNTNVIVVQTKTYTYKVGIELRIVDTSTAEIIAAAKGFAETTQMGKISLGTRGLDFGSSDFLSSSVGKCANNAVDDLIKELSSALKTANITSEEQMLLRGLVASVVGNKIYLNIGSSQGVQKGMHFVVNRLIMEIKDPVTFEVLGREYQRIAEIKADEVQSKLSICSVVIIESGMSILQSDEVVQIK